VHGRPTFSILGHEISISDVPLPHTHTSPLSPPQSPNCRKLIADIPLTIEAQLPGLDLLGQCPRNPRHFLLRSRCVYRTLGLGLPASTPTPRSPGAAVARALGPAGIREARILAALSTTRRAEGAFGQDILRCNFARSILAAVK
jgi:hypothetical protein